MLSHEELRQQSRSRKTAGPPQIVKFAEMEPQWHVPQAKEPGFMRWLTRWVGGIQPQGKNREPGPIITDEMSVGYMHMGVGQRQSAVHSHTVTEIYIVVRGQLEGWDHKGVVHRVGPMDCMYIPAGVPHSVRTVGDEDSELIWVHDGIEPLGASIYYKPGDPFPQTNEEIRVVAFHDLDPSWDLPQAKEPEYLRWIVSWVEGRNYEIARRPSQGVLSENCALKLLVLPPGNKQPRHRVPCAEAYVVLRGRAVVRQDGRNGTTTTATIIDPLDLFYVPANQPHSLRQYGSQPVYVLCVQETPFPEKCAVYEEAEA